MDRAVIGVIGVRIVTPNGIPLPGVPVIPSAENENGARVMARPPDSVVPHRRVSSKHRIILASPVLASHNSSVLLKRYASDCCRAHVGPDVEVLGLVRL